MFVKVGWTITWLFSLLAGVAAIGLAIFLTLTGYDELMPVAVMAGFALLLWITLVWAVARALRRRSQVIYVAGCAVLVVVGAAASYLPSVSAANGEVTDVSLVIPGKAR